MNVINVCGHAFTPSTVQLNNAKARDLLTMPDCCLDAGLSKILKKVAQEQAPDIEGQVRFLMSKYVYTILHAWGISISCSIFDLECMNAQARRFQVSGRP